MKIRLAWKITVVKKSTLFYLIVEDRERNVKQNCSAVVEQSTHDHKFLGSNPGTKQQREVK